MVARRLLVFQREGSANHWFGNQTAADLLDRHIAADDLAIFQNTDRLQIQPELSPGDAGRLATECLATDAG